MTKLTPFEQRIVDAGHTLRLYPNGEVDHSVLEFDNHNGPGCSVCERSWCEHCENISVGPCDGGVRIASIRRRNKIRDAAPELLEALQNLMGLYDTPIERRRRGMSVTYNETIEDARHAIALALGEDPKNA